MIFQGNEGVPEQSFPIFLLNYSKLAITGLMQNLENSGVSIIEHRKILYLDYLSLWTSFTTYLFP